MNTEATIVAALNRLVGLPLRIARDAGSMKNFQFGAIQPDPSGEGTIADFALHVQCPWRFVTTTDILTGSADYYEPAVEAGNLQQARMQQLFQTYDAETRSLINEKDSLIVVSVKADCFGGLDLELSGGVRLQVFPDGVGNENWRFFSPGNDEPHFVV